MWPAQRWSMVLAWFEKIVKHRAFCIAYRFYKHFAGLGKPAILVACFAGPCGNKRNK